MRVRIRIRVRVRMRVRVRVRVRARVRVRGGLAPHDVHETLRVLAHAGPGLGLG